MVDFKPFDDSLLQPIDSIKKPSSNEPYTVFTPFYKNASQMKVLKPVENQFKNLYTDKINIDIEDTDGYFDKILPDR